MLAVTTATPEPLGARRPEQPKRMTAPARGTTGRVVALLWLGAIVYVVVVSSIIARSSAAPVGGAPALVEQVILLLLWGAATPGIFRLAARVPAERQRWRARVAFHLAVAVAFIFVINIVAPTLAWLVVGRATPFTRVWRHGVAGFVGVGHLALIVYAFILGAGHYLHTLDVRRVEQLRAEHLRADLASAQLRALTLQLQPHFLFNTLNAVGALILTERHREAFDVVGRLGDLLRALLAIERREEVLLHEELELAQAYVGIEQARLGDRLQVRWEIAPDVGSALVPPMLLQPLVENAVRHGVSRAPGIGCLTIAARRADDRLALEIRDDGPGTAPAPGAGGARGGLGLETTRRRLAHLYGRATRLELSREGEWTVVRVELPHRDGAGDRALPNVEEA